MSDTRNPSFAALVVLTGVGPFATDTYLAALPDVQRALDTSPGVAQLTITMLIVGLAVGQLVFGPVSDAIGRRRMVVASSAVFMAFSVVCAIAPNAPVLLAARFLEGVAGGCGVAVGRAVVSDRWSGADAAARYGALASVTLLGPVLAPAIGGLILLEASWRYVFVFLALLGALMLVGVLRGIPETLPAEHRHDPGLAATAQRMGALLRNRAFARTVGVQCLATAGFFTYIGGSSIVLQDDLDISAGRYTVLFASNAAGMAVTSAVFRLTVRRVGPALLRAVGLAASTTAAVLLAAYSLLPGPVHLAPVWVLLAVVVAGMGLVIPGTTAIAQELGRGAGGTASALQGGLTFVVGAAATPLTGLTGRTTVLGMSVLMGVLFVLAAALLRPVPRRARAGARSRAASASGDAAERR